MPRVFFSKSAVPNQDASVQTWQQRGHVASIMRRVGATTIKMFSQSNKLLVFCLLYPFHLYCTARKHLSCTVAQFQIELTALQFSHLHCQNSPVRFYYQNLLFPVEDSQAQSESQHRLVLNPEQVCAATLFQRVKTLYRRVAGMTLSVTELSQAIQKLSVQAICYTITVQLCPEV